MEHYTRQVSPVSCTNFSKLWLNMIFFRVLASRSEDFGRFWWQRLPAADFHKTNARQTNALLGSHTEAQSPGEREREGGGVGCGGGVPDEECTVLLLRMDRLSIGARGQLAIKLKQLQLIVVNSGARTSEGVKKARVTKSWLVSALLPIGWEGDMRFLKTNHRAKHNKRNAIQDHVGLSMENCPMKSCSFCEELLVLWRAARCLKTFFWFWIVFPSYKHRMAWKWAILKLQTVVGISKW